MDQSTGWDKSIRLIVTVRFTNDVYDPTHVNVSPIFEQKCLYELIINTTHGACLSIRQMFRHSTETDSF